MGEAAQRPLGLLRPARARVGLGAVLQVAKHAGNSVRIVEVGWCGRIAGEYICLVRAFRAA